MRIGLLSDTHSYLHPRIREYFAECDEIWHAGDVGDIRVLDELKKMKPVRGVYGNIDGRDVRHEFPENLHFNCEGVSVLMTHIGGYPPRYNKRTRPMVRKERPGLFITGHSHILKIMHDPEDKKVLHINPGAAGKVGFHKVPTIVRFTLENGKVSDMQVIELRKDEA